MAAFADHDDRICPTCDPDVFISGAPFSGAAFNTSLNGLGGSNRVPFLPFNSLDIDKTFRVDADSRRCCHSQNAFMRT